MKCDLHRIKLIWVFLLCTMPFSSSASIEQGYAALEQGETRRAIQLFQIAVKDDPYSIAPKVGLAKSLYRKRRLADTEKIVLEILRIEPGNLDAMYLMAMIEQRKNNLEVARNLLIEVVNYQPDNQLARRDLANILNALGETELADQIYGELIE